MWKITTLAVFGLAATGLFLATPAESKADHRHRRSSYGFSYHGNNFSYGYSRGGHHHHRHHGYQSNYSSYQPRYSGGYYSDYSYSPRRSYYTNSYPSYRSYRYDDCDW